MESDDDMMSDALRRRASRHRPGPGHSAPQRPRPSLSEVSPKVKMRGIAEDAVKPQTPEVRCEDEPLVLVRDDDDESDDGPLVEATWRLKSRMKTVSVVLAVCLNIGTDPPDSTRSGRECWLDPLAGPRQKTLEAIGCALQAQYERWQSRARYRQLLDPTADELRRLCGALRRSAKGDRVLLHFNGHGVPRPTANGELWLFNKNYTQYIPLSVYELRAALQSPAVYVLDCSSAGVLLPHFAASTPEEQAAENSDGSEECIVLTPCAAHETLPSVICADVFTACLTTPISVALRFYALEHNDVPFAEVPGRLGDRKTPLGELNWIFTAVTDTIAWNVLPPALFQRLFRQDLLLASLFRNYLLAERVLRAHRCTPATLPKLPPTSDHPLWAAWDLAAEGCLARLALGGEQLLPSSQFSNRPHCELFRGLRGLAALPPATARPLEPSPFFEEQLTAFDVWLRFGDHRDALSARARPPEQLPVVLQVLLSQAHRVRALVLLRRFMELGARAVNLALCVGIFPYVLKLLQSPALDLRRPLVAIWASILAFDPSCAADLLKDEAHVSFIAHLHQLSNAAAGAHDAIPLDQLDDQRTLVAFVLASVLENSDHDTTDACVGKRVHDMLIGLLDDSTSATFPNQRLWALLAISALIGGEAAESSAKMQAARDSVTMRVAKVVSSDVDLYVRAAALHALATMHRRHRGPNACERCIVIGSLDASPVVRAQAAISVAACLAADARQRRRFARAAAKPAAPVVLAGPTPEGAARARRRQQRAERAAAADVHSERAFGTRAFSAFAERNSSDEEETDSDEKESCAEDEDETDADAVNDTGLFGVCAALETLCSDPSANVAAVARDVRAMYSMDDAVAVAAYKHLLKGGVVASRRALFARPRTKRADDADDPLSAAGEMRLYRRQRNRAVLAGRALLTCSGVNRAASTDPAPALEGASPNGLGLAGTKVLSAANLHALAFQSSFQSSAAPLAPKKVKFSQTATLENPRAEMTSVLKFHAFEPYLAVVDDEAGVSLWAYEQGRCDFRWEANRKTDERVTTLEWLNASTTSLLLCGSDDGVVSVWGGFDLDCDKEFQGLVGQAPCVPRTPTLVSAFVAADDLSKGSRSSGLVTAWHKASATLFAAGHSPHVRVWDLASEALSATVQTTTDACVTSMASSNRCTVFAGFGDGSLRLFDTRALGGKAALRFGREHSGWIVHTSERAPHEVASGCVAGDLRFWDVRKPDESYRLVDVQTSTMTALVAHESAPLLMSGSHNQFIKFLTRSGEQLNVVRYHDGFLGQRIGPVSALAFHPNKLVCAAGSTDAIIGLYAA